MHALRIIMIELLWQLKHKIKRHKWPAARIKKAFDIETKKAAAQYTKTHCHRI
jgi:hypothetical protein